MTSYDTDLLVVGGGPGGLATALHARARGLSVIVAEPRENPIDKACGGRIDLARRGPGRSALSWDCLRW